MAYYPAGAGELFTVANDQTADSDYKASDLMFASVTDQAKQAEAVELAHYLQGERKFYLLALCRVS